MFGNIEYCICEGAEAERRYITNFNGHSLKNWELAMDTERPGAVMGLKSLLHNAEALKDS